MTTQEIDFVCGAKDSTGFYITAFHSDKKCSYQPEGSCFMAEKLSPDRLCLEAFNIAYPACFSLLHIPDSSSIVVCCPNPLEGLTFNVYRRPARWMRRIKNIIAHFINILYPIDIIRYRIFIEVVDKGKDCPYKYRQGETFELNLGQKPDEVCPAAFNSIFPSLFFSIAENHKSVRTIGAACPDHRVNVQLWLNNSEAKDTPLPDDPSVDCMPEEKVIIQVIEAGPGCPMHYSKGQEYDISIILEELGISCLSVFHTLFPYYLVLLRGGGMPGFYTHDKHAAFFQCPSIKNKLEMMIKKDKKSSNFFLYITGQRQNCPKGLSCGQKITLGPKNRLFCLHLLHNIAPYVNALKLKEERANITVSCPTCGNNRVIFGLLRR